MLNEITIFITNNLSEKLAKSLISFIGFIESNNMDVEMFIDDTFVAKLNEHIVCYIVIQKDAYRVIHIGEYSKGYEGLNIPKKLIWENVVLCSNCPDCSSAPGKNEVIMDKEFNNVCQNAKIRFQNPIEKELDCAKQIVLWRLRQL